MATRSFKVYQGEDLSPEFDYTDAVKWDQLEVGSKAFNGESTLSTVIIRDEFGETGNEIGLPSGLTHKSLAARNIGNLIVGSNTLWSGRIGVKDYSRDGRQSERYRNAHVQFFDRNIDLDEIIVDGNFNRDSETDVARVQGLVASFYSGVAGQIGPVAGLNPRPTTNLNGSNLVVAGSNLITLPAQDYTRTSALEVLKGIAADANKVFWVNQEGTGLFYDGKDSTALRSPLRISDRQSEIGGWTFPPIWNVGAASTEDGMQQRAGLRLYYGAAQDAYVDAYSQTVATQYAHTAEIIYDDTIVSATQAQRRVNREVDFRSKERRTYSCSVGPLSDEQVHFVKVGMLVSIKARAIPDADDQYVDRRIVEIKYTTPVPGTWFVHMRLDQTLSMAPLGPGTPPGPQPPSAGTADLVLYDLNWDNGLPHTVDIYPSGTGSWPTGGTDGTVVDSGGAENGSGYVNAAGGAIDRNSPYLPAGAGETYIFDGWYRQGGGFLQNPDYSVYWYDVSGTLISSEQIAAPGASPSWTNVVSEATAPAGTVKMEFNKSAGFQNSDYDNLMISLKGTGPDTTGAVVGTGEASTGSLTGTLAPVDHEHEHGNITTGGPYHMAEDSTVVETGTLTGTDVQTALENLAARIAALEP